MSLTQTLVNSNNLSKEEFIEECWERNQEYINGVSDGSILTNKWIKLAVKRYQNDRDRIDLGFRRDKVERVFKFFRLIYISSKNKKIRFLPTPFQCFILANLFGFYRIETGFRRFNYAFIFTGKKSGKTSFSAALQAYFLLGDGELDPQSLLVAATKEQAGHALKYLRAMVNNSPDLLKRLSPQRNQVLIKDKKMEGFSKTVASDDPDKLQGHNISAAILDEIMAYKNEDLFTTVKSSTIARDNPMVLLISTAAFSKDGFCAEMVLRGKNTLKGDIENDSFFFLLYTLDDDDDIHDKSCWPKSNPSIGVIFNIEKLIDEYTQALSSRSEMKKFITLHLNIFTEETDSWIPDEDVKKCSKNIKIEDFKGMDCLLAMDLSSTRDLTSVLALFWKEKPDGGNEFFVFPFFFSADNPEKFIRKGGYNIIAWAEQGYINRSSQKTVDYNEIYILINKLMEDHNIIKLYYDKWNSSNLVNKLMIDPGLFPEPFPQTTQHFNKPLKYIEELVFTGNITIANNPVMEWNFRNAVLYKDGNGSIKIMKNKSLDSVDGIVSLGMAMGGFLKTYYPDDEKDLN